MMELYEMNMAASLPLSAVLSCLVFPTCQGGTVVSQKFNHKPQDQENF